MSNPRAKSNLVTYSRAKRKLPDDNNSSIKRRRVVVVDVFSDSEVDETSISTGVPASSPPLTCPSSDPPVFSDENTPALTPPSSPPPSSPPPMLPATDEQGKLSVKTRKIDTANMDGCSVLRRAPSSRLKKKPLVQMQLNLGQPFQKKCKMCGMEYVPSNPEDAALHRKFHSRNVDGVYVSKDLIKKAEGWGGIEWHGKDGEDRIVSISRHWRCRSGRQHVMPVLEIVQAELGAVDIPYDLLWSLCYARLPPLASNEAQITESSAEAVDRPCYERYKVYLYIHGTKCVGLCLVERINKAHKVLDPGEAEPMLTRPEDGNSPRPSSGTQNEAIPNQDAQVQVSETEDDAFMGVSRIWVSSSFRNQGIATALLDCASKTFRENSTTPKDLIAFSQPTQSGARLARRWFDLSHGWHVYSDCNTIMTTSKGDWYSRREDEVVEQ